MTTNDEGVAEALLSLGLPVAPFAVRVVDESGQSLAEGEARLGVPEWRRAAKRRGGWLAGGRTGALTVEAGPARGVFAVPFAGELVVRVTHDGEPARGARVSIDCDGAEAAMDARTAADGVAFIRVVPRAHAPSCLIRARAEALEGQVHVALPVVAGALYARREGDAVVVESPTDDRRAYVAFVTDEARLGAHAVALGPGPRGSVGRLGLLPHERSATHAVVSSEADFRSPSLVGWPIGKERARAGFVQRTFDVRDELLVDGAPRALSAERRRRRRVRDRTVGALVLIALSTGGLFALVARASARERGLARRGWMALIVVTLGLLGYVLFAWGQLT